jgi:hypothetical protein
MVYRRQYFPYKFRFSLFSIELEFGRMPQELLIELDRTDSETIRVASGAPVGSSDGEKFPATRIELLCLIL